MATICAAWVAGTPCRWRSALASITARMMAGDSISAMAAAM